MEKNYNRHDIIQHAFVSGSKCVCSF